MKAETPASELLADFTYNDFCLNSSGEFLIVSVFLNIDLFLTSVFEMADFGLILCVFVLVGVFES